jgi:translation initiation factor IF-2
MEQRPLRLGDIVDDYCPRERRVTNHAVVALVDDTVKQTRCTTCDHEHVFKHAKEPRRRKKDDTSALYSQVLSGLQKMPGSGAEPAHAEPRESVTHMANDDEHDIERGEIAAPAAAAPAEPARVVAEVAAIAQAAAAVIAEDEGPQPGNEAGDDEPWSMHRRLIRAQLPRIGNEPPPARPLPDFTIRQPGARGGPRPWRGGGEPNGNTANGNNRHGHGQGRGGHGQGQGGGQGRPGRGGGRFSGPRPDGGRRGGQGQGPGGGGRPGGGRGRRSR